MKVAVHSIMLNMRHTIRVFLSLCMAAVCTASNAEVSDSSCSASVKPLEATRALTQSALLACSVVLQPTGALEWLIDVQQVRLRDILDGRLVDTVELPAHCGITLAELVQQCWPSPALPVRAFLSELDQELHSRLCVSASVAAADALHNPILSLTRVILSVDSLPALPVAIAASVIPHATVAAVLIPFAPAAMVVAPLWTMAIVFFALVDLCHTPLRVVDAFRKSKKRVVTLFLRRMFARVVMALFVAFIDSIAMAVSSCMFLLAFAVRLLRSPSLCGTRRLQPQVSPSLLLAPTFIAFATLVTTTSAGGDPFILFLRT